jgi:tRNA-modifying protein YgfZ
MPRETPFHAASVRSGAVMTEEEGWLVPCHFGRPDEEYNQIGQHAGMFDRSHRGKITLEGADSQRFLHNLCTNDVLGLPAGAGCEAFLTTNKAKAIAYLLVFHQEDSSRLWLDTEPGRAEIVAHHLDRYLISERVEIFDQTSTHAQLYVVGPKAPEILASSLSLPSDPGPMHEVRATLSGKSPLWARRRDLLSGLPGYDVICPPDLAEPLWQTLADHSVAPEGSQTYDILRVEAGIPVWGHELNEERMVVEAGRGTQAISYTKGCYLGQETIVMARDRGHVNRILMGMMVEGKEPVPAGTKLMQGESEAGEITSSVLSPRFGRIALAYLRRGHQEPRTELKLSGVGRRAVVTSLTFPTQAK